MEVDPALTWQVMQDLKNDDFSLVFKERQQISKKGWGYEILSNQAENGMWANGLYTPKWTSTTYSVLLLKRIGLLPNQQTKKASALLFEKGIRSDGGINFSKNNKSSETCITGIILGISSYFVLQDKRLKTVIDYLQNEQMDDGGWNCRKSKDASHSSFNTTLLVLEGLIAYREMYDDKLSEIRDMQKNAHEFLLYHGLYKSHRSGEIAHKDFIKLSFPNRWKYNILAALDYFQSVNFSFDDRFIDAMELLNAKQKNGKWLGVKSFYHGSSWVTAEKSRSYSRWVTFKALRINKWWKSISRGKI
jgi:hypothetical protein